MAEEKKNTSGKKNAAKNNHDEATKKTRTQTKKSTSDKKTSSGKKKTEASSQKKKQTLPPRESSFAEKETKSVPAKKKKEKNPSSLIHQLMVIFLFFLAVFVVICFAFPNTCGKLGMGLSHTFFGLFGVSAFLVPFLLFQLALFWKRDAESGAVKYKYIVAIATLLMVAMLSHTWDALITKAPAFTFKTSFQWETLKALYADGIHYHGGGFLGGFFASLFLCLVGYPGALIFGTLFFVLLVMALFGLTPIGCLQRYLLYRARSKSLRDAQKLKKEKRRAEAEKAAYERQCAAEAERRRREREQQRILWEEQEKREEAAFSEETGEEMPLADEPLVDTPAEEPSRKSRIDIIFEEDAVFGVPEQAPQPHEEIVYAQEPIMPQAHRTEPLQKETPTVLSHAVGYDNHSHGDTFYAESARPYAPSKGIGERTGTKPQNAIDENLYTFSMENVSDKVTFADVSERNAVSQSVPSQKEEISLDEPMPMAPPPVFEEFSAPQVPEEPAFAETCPVLEEEKKTMEDKFAVAEIKGMMEEASSEPEEISILPPEPMVEAPAADDGTLEDIPVRPAYTFPPMELLAEADENDGNENVSAELRENADKIIQTLESFRVHVKISHVSRGPTVTRYELEPAAGTRVRNILNLLDDIALSLATSGVRSDGIITGKSAIGIEVPNKITNTVYVRELIEDNRFADAKSRLTTCLGMDVSGAPVYLDIAKMPHLLIAGATGMGKSVCINSLLVSLLYKARPDEVKLILIDPKKVELNIYNGIPHLLVPVVFDPKKAAGSLHWAVTEMERRFELIEAMNTRNIAQYNAAIADDPKKEFLPQIVIIIDELADLMMSAPDDVEASICRLAQKARAAGMHLIIGTQRPSVDVITGLIKANIPSRIAFTVASQIDSRTIIDTQGAEKLIGRGDMLYAPVGASKPIRVQGSFVSEKEIDDIVTFIKAQAMGTLYSDDVMEQIKRAAEACGQKKGKGGGGMLSSSDGGAEESDPMLESAIALAVESGKISTSLIQRRLSLGYGRAAKIIDMMERRGIVSAPEGQKPRTVLITREQYLEMQMHQSDDSSAQSDFDDEAPF